MKPMTEAATTVKPLRCADHEYVDNGVCLTSKQVFKVSRMHLFYIIRLGTMACFTWGTAGSQLISSAGPITGLFITADQTIKDRIKMTGDREVIVSADQFDRYNFVGPPTLFPEILQICCML